MDDRDKDLTGLFVRDLDTIPLPARGAWRRVSGRETIVTRTSRYLFTATAIAAVLVLALVVGLQLRDRNTPAANPSASPTPSASGAAVIVPSPTSGPSGSASPTASPSPAPSGGIYNDDFGFFVTDNFDRAHARTESSNAPIGDFSMRGFAVSPDGTRLAYWTQGPTEAAGAPQELRVVVISNPSSPALIVSSGLSDKERGGGIVWSNDGRGLAYAIQTGSPTTGSTVRILDLVSGGAARVVLTLTEPGRLYVPVAWDRSVNLIAAGVTGDGGFMTRYVTVRVNPTNELNEQRSDVAGRVTMGSVRASTDAKLVVGVDIDTGFSYWPMADYAAKVTPAETKYGLTGALWRPGTHEIGFIGPSKQFWLCNADRNTPLGCGSTAFSGVADGAVVRLFRVDGSAVLLHVIPPGSSNLVQTYTLVRLGSDPKATTGDRVTFTELGGLNASVRLR